MKIMQKIGLSALAAMLLAGLTALPSRAQLTLSLNTVPLTAEPVPLGMGETVTVEAILTNIGTEGIDLTDVIGTLIGADPSTIQFSDTDFVDNLPLSLAASDSYTQNLFLTGLPTLVPGEYTLTYVVSGSGVTTSSPYSGSDTFNIAAGGTVTVPEPGTFALLTSALLPGVALFRRRKLR